MFVFVKYVLTDDTHEARNNSVVLGKNVHTSARKVLRYNNNNNNIRHTKRHSDFRQYIDTIEQH